MCCPLFVLENAFDRWRIHTYCAIEIRMIIYRLKEKSAIINNKVKESDTLAV